MRLAEVAGVLDWNLALQQIDPWQYLLWKARDILEGIGSKRDDRRAAEMQSWNLAAHGLLKTVDDLAFDIEAMAEKSQVAEKPTKESTRATVFAAMGIPVPPPLPRRTGVTHG